MSDQYTDLAQANSSREETQNEEQALRVVSAQIAASVRVDSIHELLANAALVYDWIETGDKPEYIAP